VDVEAALAVERLGRGVEGGRSKGELQIEDGLDVTIKAVVALPGKDPVPILQFEDRVLGIGIEVVGVGCSPSALMRQVEGLHGGRISGSS